MAVEPIAKKPIIGLLVYRRASYREGMGQPVGAIALDSWVEFSRLSSWSVGCLIEAYGLSLGVWSPRLEFWSVDNPIETNHLGSWVWWLRLSSWLVSRQLRLSPRFAGLVAKTIVLVSWSPYRDYRLGSRVRLPRLSSWLAGRLHETIASVRGSGCQEYRLG